MYKYTNYSKVAANFCRRTCVSLYYLGIYDKVRAALQRNSAWKYRR